MDVTLKPCPFCGKQPGVDSFYSAVMGLMRFSIACDNDDCLVQPSTNVFSTLDEAEDAWNTRVGEDMDVPAMPERTCTVKYSCCSNFSDSLDEFALSCGHIVIDFATPSYCVECGARVIQEVE